MPSNVLPNEMVVKNKAGVFRLLKNGQLVDLPSDQLLAPADDLITRQLAEEIKKTSADFYFDVNDEHEARQLADQGGEHKNQLIKQYIKTSVDEIFKQLNLAGRSVALTQLSNIVISRLKDVRSLAETREALLKQGLDKDQASEILNLTEEKRGQVEEVIKTGKLPALFKISPTKSAQAPPQISLVVDSQREAAAGAEHGGKEKQIAAIKKLDMHGIKYDPGQPLVFGQEIGRHVTVGPIDELRQLSLKEFRRLGNNPREAAARILEKIGLLEDESLIKKAAGTKAWQESEVYKTYLSLGAASMSARKPVEQVIREFRAAAKPYLAPEEFNIVADLNRKLSY